MSTSAITADVRAVSAYARTDALVTPVQPVRRDPNQPRFDLLDALAGRRTPQRPAPVERTPDTSQAEAVPEGIDVVERRPRQPARPFTAFVAQAIAQADDDGMPPPSAFRIGSHAYNAQAATVTGETGPAPQISGLFPHLASGRALDLTV